jgi:hypothetical protein
VRVLSLNGEPAREELFIAAAIIPPVPMPYGRDPFLKSAPSAISLSWLKKKEKGE